MNEKKKRRFRNYKVKEEERRKDRVRERDGTVKNEMGGDRERGRER